MNITIASGKGGTGKSTIALSLFTLLAEKGIRVGLVDCDVEEPNCHLFLKITEQIQKNANVSFPKVNFLKCTGCRECSDFCEYNALAVIQGPSCSKCVKYCNEKPVPCEGNEVLIFKELCHSCGGCKLVCPAGAISEKKRSIGEIIEAKVKIDKFYLPFIYGRLHIGEAKSPPLIKQVKETKSDLIDVKLIDGPPGTSCTAISAVEGSDYVFLVTEPTPFGLNDLSLAVDMVKKIGINFGIIVNKSSEYDYLIDDYARSKNIEILAKIPDERTIAEAYSKGSIFINDFPEYKSNFLVLIKLIEKRIKL